MFLKCISVIGVQFDYKCTLIPNICSGSGLHEAKKFYKQSNAEQGGSQSEVCFSITIIIITIKITLITTSTITVTMIITITSSIICIILMIITITTTRPGRELYRAPGVWDEGPQLNPSAQVGNLLRKGAKKIVVVFYY